MIYICIYTQCTLLQSPKTALKQLDQLLKSGTPARADAHRGTYLNVLV